MSKQKIITSKSYPYTRVFAVIAFILLTAFAGRIAAPGICASIQKNTQVSATQNQENEDGSEKEDGKFAEKELNACFLLSGLALTPISGKADIVSYHLFIDQLVKTHFLTVLTPPPNC